MNEDMLLPFFEEFGSILELTVIRDKSSKVHRGTSMNNIYIFPSIGCAFYNRMCLSDVCQKSISYKSD